MPKVVCTCGARYQLPAGTEGKRAKCKKCGVIFVIPKPKPVPAEPGDMLALLEEAATQAKRAEVAAPSALAAAVENAPAAGASIPRATAIDEVPALRGRQGTLPAFLRDAAWAFLFLIQPSNLVIMLIMWAVRTLKIVVGFAPCIGIIASLIISGWYISFLFNTVAAAAAGEDDLPTLSLTEGIVDDVIMPLIKYVGVTLVLLLPAIAYLVWTATELLSGGPQVLLEGGSALRDEGLISGPFVALLLLALFLWPISILAVALQGLGAVVRLDLALRTIACTFVPYVLTCALVGGSFWVQDWLSGQLLGRAMMRGKGLDLGKLFVAGIVVSGLTVYVDIVAMRIVGLYYRHYRKRFAWTWE
ncbi:MAG TPA: hypothetical protein VGM03_13470 [Phycisphaerae bacterium]|jgi:hypothetical protein